jgi:hypothetical protein
MTSGSTEVDVGGTDLGRPDAGTRERRSAPVHAAPARLTLCQLLSIRANPAPALGVVAETMVAARLAR